MSSCETLNYDNAPRVHVVGKERLPFRFTVTYPDPVDLSNGTFRLVISSDQYGDCPVYGATANVTGQVLTVDVPADHGLLWGNYRGEVVNDVDGEMYQPILTIDLRIKPTIPRTL